VRDDSVLSLRFVILICLSSGIAAFGLLSNSAAAIIGAMIVAPLMTPILGSALGMVIGIDVLFRRSLITEIVGVACAIGIGFLCGAFPFHPAPGSEMINRTAPNLYDLGIALLSGFAGAYATTNVKVNPALAGVAISVSLVPPLANCGVLIAFGMERMALGAFSLFLLNFLCIQIAAAIVFAAAGFRPRINDDDSRKVYVWRFVPPLVALVAMVGFATQSLLALVRKENVRRSVEVELARQIRQRTGCELDRVVELRERDGGLYVVATAFTPRPYQADQVAAIKRHLDRRLATDVDLVIRSLPTSDMTATGAVAAMPEDPEDPDKVNRNLLQSTFMAALSPVKGARLGELDLTATEDGWIARALVYAPRPVEPERVAEIEAAMSSAVSRQVDLQVETLNIVAADRDGFIDPNLAELP